MNFRLNRSQLKNIALVFMVFDHVCAFIFIRFWGIAHLTSRFVAPLFAWLMVDGFFHTKSRGKYCSRLWIAAILMQIEDELSHAIFKEHGIPNNVFMTLAIGFSIIWLFELAKTSEDHRKKILLRIAAIVLTLLAMAMSIVHIPLPMGSYLQFEGGIDLIPFILFSYFFHSSKKKQAFAVLIYNLFMFFVVCGGFSSWQGFDMFCINSDWMSLLAIPFIFLYNGEEGRKTPFSKWFFYVFYPAHLWVIVILRTFFINLGLSR